MKDEYFIFIPNNKTDEEIVVEAEFIKPSVYFITGDIPSDEGWKFSKGQTVRCDQHIISGGIAKNIASSLETL